MTTLADVAGYRRVETGIHRTYVNDLQWVTQRIAGSTPVRQRDTLLRAFPEMVLPRVTAMQDFAATWADDLYAGQSTGTRAPNLVLPDDDAMEATVRWAVAPAFGEAAGTVFSNLSGAGQRYIADAGRSTVVGIQPRGRSGVRMRRFPEPDACEWCVATAEVTPDSHDHCHCVIAPVFAGDTL